MILFQNDDTHLAYVLLDVSRFCISVLIFKRVKTQRCSIQVFVLTSIYSKRVLSSVSLCNAPVPFHADNFSPNLVVYRQPLVNDLLNVILLFSGSFLSRFKETKCTYFVRTNFI